MLGFWTANGIAWTLASLYMVARRSTAAENIYTASSTLERVSGSLYRYDLHGRHTEEVDLARSVGAAEVKTVRAYAGQLLDTVTAANGTATNYEYADLLRQTRTTAGCGGSAPYPSRIEDTRYDGANRVAETYSCACATASTSFLYDPAGHLFYKRSSGLLVAALGADGRPGNGPKTTASDLLTPG